MAAGRRSCLLQFRIRIANRGEISGARAGVQLAENRIAAGLGFQLGHAAVGVVGIAKNDGLGGTGGFASSHDFAIANVAVLFFRFDARVVDALHAVGAFFHDPAAAHGDFRIAQELKRRCLPILEAEKIKAANLVGAVVRTIARADAAVVNHVVQAFRAVHGGADRADLLAGRVLALLARDGLEKCLGVIERVPFAGRRIVGGRLGRVITVDTDPVHLAAAHYLVLAYDGNIVFRLTRHNASIAAIATVQIDGHAPGIAGVGEFLVKRHFLGRLFIAFVRELGVLLVFGECTGGQNLPAFHVEVILGAG